MADRELERHLGRRDPVALRRPAGAARPVRPVGHLDVAAAGELVEVVAGHVGVQVEALGHLGGGDPGRRSPVGRRCGVHEEVDLAPGGVAEGRGDGGDRRGELGR